MFSYDERMAASAVASLAGKHSREPEDHEMRDCKKARVSFEDSPSAKEQSSESNKKTAPATLELKPAPFFYYRDFSTVPDPDPLTPLTSPGRVPTFVAKMHAILSRPELKDVVAWLPHGRSWRVLKPREFEIKVLPKFFEHAKFSSFVRQANGWGFRRITQGPDRNSYYHERFLRGLPHLSKDMKRPGVAQKKTADPEHEPDLYKISELHPLPNKAEDDSILLQSTLQNGPKARVPIYSGAFGSLSLASMAAQNSQHSHMPPRDQGVLNSFQQSIAASEDQFRSLISASARGNETNAHTQTSVPLPSFLSAPSAFAPAPSASSARRSTLLGTADRLSALAAANQLSFHAAPPSLSTALNASSAASQFAAGFAAATAYSQQQFRDILENLAQQQQHQNNNNGFQGFR